MSCVMLVALPALSVIASTITATTPEKPNTFSPAIKKRFAVNKNNAPHASHFFEKRHTTSHCFGTISILDHCVREDR